MGFGGRPAVEVGKLWLPWIVGADVLGSDGGAIWLYGKIIYDTIIDW